jgi:hypothetical protein
MQTGKSRSAGAYGDVSELRNERDRINRIFSIRSLEESQGVRRGERNGI